MDARRALGQELASYGEHAPQRMLAQYVNRRLSEKRTGTGENFFTRVIDGNFSGRMSRLLLPLAGFQPTTGRKQIRVTSGRLSQVLNTDSTIQ